MIEADGHMLAGGKNILAHVKAFRVPAVNIVIPSIAGIEPAAFIIVVVAAAVIGSGRAVVVERVQSRRIGPIRNIGAAVPIDVLYLLPCAGAGAAGAGAAIGGVCAATGDAVATVDDGGVGQISIDQRLHSRIGRQSNGNIRESVVSDLRLSRVNRAINDVGERAEGIIAARGIRRLHAGIHGDVALLLVGLRCERHDAQREQHGDGHDDGQGALDGLSHDRPPKIKCISLCGSAV